MSKTRNQTYIVRFCARALGGLLGLVFLLPHSGFASLSPWIQQGNKAYYQGDYRQAETLYLKACAQEPGSPGGYYGAALCEYLLGDFPASESNVEKALRLDPGFKTAQELLSRVRRKGDPGPLQDLQVLIGLREGVLYYRMHEYHEAQEIFEKACATYPGSEEAHFNLGATYLKLKQWDKAEAEFKQCLKLKPGDSRAEYALGVLYEKKGGAFEAQDYFFTAAQAPGAGPYSLAAFQRLSTLRLDGDNSPFHISFRLQGGGGESTLDQVVPGPNAPPLTSTGTNGYGHLQMDYGAAIGKQAVRLSYAGDGAWSQTPGQNPSFFTLHDFSVGSTLPLPSGWKLPLSFDEQLGLNSSGALYYQHHQASTALQWFFQGPDLIQVQAQYLREIYPAPVNLGVDNWTAGFSTSILLGGAHYFSLSYSFRESMADTAQTDFYNYFLNSVALVYHVEFGKGWSASLSYSPQWQSYPFFYDEYGNPRSDWIQNLGGEFTLPVDARWSFVLGDQFQQIWSSYSLYSQHSNNYYAGTQMSF